MATIEDRIRERRRALADRMHGEGELFPVPGYDDDDSWPGSSALWVRLRYMSAREVDALVQQYDNQVDRQVHQLIACCRGIYTSDTGLRDDVQRVEVDGVPVGFDRLLAARFGFLDDVTIKGEIRPADVVLALISDHYVEVLCRLWLEWMASTSSNDPVLGVADDPVGESVPTPTSSGPLGSG